MKPIKNIIFISVILLSVFLISASKTGNADTSENGSDNSFFTVYDEFGGQAISPIVFSGSESGCLDIDRTSSGNMIIAYADSGNADAGTFSIFDTLGGQAIAPKIFNPGSTGDVAVVILLSDYMFFAYSDAANSSAGTISIYDSAGDLAIGPIVFSGSQTFNINIIEHTNGNIIIAYTNAGNSNYGEFVVYGSNGVKALGPIEFNPQETENISITELANENILIAYSNEASGGRGEFVIYSANGGKVSGPTVFKEAAVKSISAVKLTNDNVFIAYADKTNSDYGELLVYDTNLNELLPSVVFNPGKTGGISVKELDNENIFIAYGNEENSGSAELTVYNSLREAVVSPAVFSQNMTGEISLAKTSSGYIFIAYSNISAPILTRECVESDWTYFLEPNLCPESGLQIKKWELTGDCAGGASHPESEDISCIYESGLPVCVEADWKYTLSPVQCPASGIQIKNWELVNDCAGGVSHPESEEINCVFSKTINAGFLERLKGRIVLRVEANGEAYYINNSGTMFYLGRPTDAFRIMREQGIGIKTSDLEKIAAGPGQNYAQAKMEYNFAAAHKGKIFLQVEENGEAWYIYPDDAKKYYLGRPVDAFSIMRGLGLGISESNFNKL